jgi:hypothetical protein
MWSIFLILVLLIPLLAVVLDSKLGQALARRIEGAAPDDARLRALEAEVDRLSGEVERIREEADFLTRLLEERTEGEEQRLPPATGGEERGG